MIRIEESDLDLVAWLEFEGCRSAKRQLLLQKQ